MRIPKPKKPGELIGAMNSSKMTKKMSPMFKHKKRHHKVSPLTGLTEGSPKDMKMDAKIATRMDKMEMHKKPKLGSGKRFAALKSKLGKKGATNPGALAAFIGRKALGKKKFQTLAAKGRARAAKK